MSRYFCPICGKALLEEFAIGYICACCGNESCVSDDILPKELEKFTNKDLNSAGYVRSDLEKYDCMPVKVAHRLLRAKWINSGCKWKYNDENEMPNDWSLEKAKQQLSTIDEDIDDYINR